MRRTASFVLTIGSLTLVGSGRRPRRVPAPDLSKFKGRSNPVEQVSWNDIQVFLKALNDREGCSGCYRLSTEAEWEYAYRAGSTGPYYWGDDADAIGQYAWYDKNSGEKTHPAGQLKPNAWGLYDMAGNVDEWTADCYH